MVYESDSDHTITYSSRPFDTQLQENVNHIYHPHRHIVQYIGHDYNHVNQQSDEDESTVFYRQIVPSATNKYNSETYVDEQTERFASEGYLHSQLISLPTYFHHGPEELEEGVSRLMSAIQYFLQSVTSVSNIGPLEQDRLATHFEHMLYTTHRSFPAHLINDTAQFMHMLMHKIHTNTAGTLIHSSHVPVTAESSFGNCVSESAGLGTPSLPVSQNNTRDIGKEFESFPSIAHIPPYIQCLFMPQQVYSSRAKADHHRYVKDADLRPAIIFCSKHCDYVGISLRDILDARLNDILVDANEIVLDHGPPSAYIRLRVPGYAPDGKQKHQISLKTYERSKNPLTKARLLRSVANAIKKILQNLANEQQDDQHVADLPFKWTIGNGAGQIGIHNLCIASLHNVSQGTWQPHLYLDPNYQMSNEIFMYNT